ncbi:MAG: ATP-binding protein [Verrucomicrobiales bacterium]|nr:ATP-binding protein [Verrucomicrobiales bacterium]
MGKRAHLVYIALLIAWAVIAGWQSMEHRRVRRAARAELINRAKDISTTLGIVLRSQRRFGGVISKERLESALQELVNPQELRGVALLNVAGEVVASAGEPIDPELKGLLRAGAHWGKDTVTLMNLVDLGADVSAESEGPRPTIILPRMDRPPQPTNAPGPILPGPGAGPQGMPQPFPPGQQFLGHPPPTGAAPATEPAAPWPQRERQGRPRFGRPPWMTEDQYKALIEKQGVHSFVIALSTHAMRTAINHDLWLRIVICGLATVAVFGLGLAWRNLVRSSELEVRLARAAELNARLREMNIAAAGLAHETKNPLNIIRGLAQLVAKQESVPADVREKCREIVEEVDRVTAQLNEFINFSRPREVRRTAVRLNNTVNDVVRTLGHDIEEKAVKLEIQPDMPTIEADEQQLRQALFNLLLNAIQAVDRNGRIQVLTQRIGPNEIALEIRDNGPGVPPEHRTEIFKPYFTTNEKGTGLGLAIVHQIVLAHGWEIECLPNEPRGAVFRISHIKVLG